MAPELVTPTMPYINLKTSIGEFPFLIDTGANINLIHPSLAKSYASAKPYTFATNGIGSANGKFNAKSAIDINFFSPKINHCAQFILHDFHSFFKGIIGTGILRALSAKIDLSNNMLYLSKKHESINIPLQQYSPVSKTTHNQPQ